MISPDIIGVFDEHPFLRSRIPTLETLAWSRSWHHVPILMEVDVTLHVTRFASRRRGPATVLDERFFSFALRTTYGMGIHAEIRAAQTAPVGKGEVQVDAARAEWKTRLFTMPPEPFATSSSGDGFATIPSWRSARWEPCDVR